MRWTDRHKPAAAVGAHLAAAGVMWSVVGAALAGAGTVWIWEATTAAAAWLTVGAVVLGVAKSLLVLDRSAGKIVARILARGDGRCLGGFLSLRTWGLVIVMMAAGRQLRGTFAHSVVGPLYLTVGVALLVSSRHAWRAWREDRRRS